MCLGVLVGLLVCFVVFVLGWGGWGFAVVGLVCYSLCIVILQCCLLGLFGCFVLVMWFGWVGFDGEFW